jgi:hypothetical protein
MVSILDDDALWEGSQYLMITGKVLQLSPGPFLF